jgi:hypothetical protein
VSTNNDVKETFKKIAYGLKVLCYIPLSILYRIARTFDLKGGTPMSGIKILLMAFSVPMLIGAIFLLSYHPAVQTVEVYPQATLTHLNVQPTVSLPSGFKQSMTVYSGSTQNNQGSSVNGAVSSATPCPTWDYGLPSGAVNVTPYPSYIPNQYDSSVGGVNNNGAIPCPTPRPTIYENPVTIDDNNYIKTDGFAVVYPLSKNVQLKSGQKKDINIKLTNLGDKDIKHINLAISVVLFGTTWGEPNQAIIYTKSVDYGSVDIKPYESYNLTYSMAVPAIRGHYDVMLGIMGDQGSNAQIMQEITIK